MGNGRARQADPGRPFHLHQRHRRADQRADTFAHVSPARSSCCSSLRKQRIRLDRPFFGPPFSCTACFARPASGSLRPTLRIASAVASATATIAAASPCGLVDLGPAAGLSDLAMKASRSPVGDVDLLLPCAAFARRDQRAPSPASPAVILRLPSKCKIAAGGVRSLIS